VKRIVCIRTIGCRTNQADSLELAAALAARGALVTDEPEGADVVVVNTCAVTAKAERDVRRELGRAGRVAPGARIAVAGCMAHRSPPELWRRYGVTGVFTNPRKGGIAAWAAGDGGDGAAAGASWLMGVLRPPLKVQEGCAKACSYCVVPGTRGRERSLPAARVLDGMRRLAAAGAREAVLTGTQLGSWGKDLDPPRVLADLVETLLEAALPLRIRLSSVEPWGVTGRLVRLFAEGREALCPHLHVPAQSGSDAVLRAMRRPCDAARWRELALCLREARPDLAIGTDLIAGFPGEGAREHEETLRLVEEAPLSYLHVFSYSRREGTAAAALGGEPGAAETRRRTSALVRLGERKRAAFVEGFAGKRVDVVVERFDACRGAEGTSAHFFKVLLPPEAGACAALVGHRIEATVTGTEGGTAIGTIPCASRARP